MSSSHSPDRADNPSPYEIELKNALLSAAPVEGFSSLLDIGCGEGEFIDEILNIVRIGEVWGIDPDEDAVSRAKSFFNRHGPDIPSYFFAGDGRQPDLPRKKFACVSFQDILHHLYGGVFSHSLDEVRRGAVEELLISADNLLEDGGLLVLGECIAEREAGASQAVRTGIHNLKAEIDSLHRIPHSHTYYGNELGDALQSWLKKSGYQLYCSGIFETQNNSIEFGREDRAAETVFDFFSGYIQTLVDAPRGEALPEPVSEPVADPEPESEPESEPATHMDRKIAEFSKRLEALRIQAKSAGIRAQKRLLLVARKAGSV